MSGFRISPTRKKSSHPFSLFLSALLRFSSPRSISCLSHYRSIPRFSPAHYHLLHERRTMTSDAKQQGPLTELILEMPAMVPPPGQVSNLMNPNSNRGTSIAILLPFIILSSLFVIARMYTKLFIIRKMHKEDCKL